MEVQADVFTCETPGIEKVRTNFAVFTFVAIDRKTMKPVPVPKISPETKDE